MFLKVLRLIWVQTLCLSSVPIIAGGGSSVGTGGDPLYHYVETIRVALVATTKLFYFNPKEQEGFCKQEALNQEQQAFCRKFFLAISRQVLVLNQGDKRTSFVIRDEPLYILENGKMIRVAARTPKGRSGDVEFDRDLVNVMGPQNLMLLVAHEFGHKSEFEGRYLDDTTPIGPFANGRSFLDALGQAVVDLAKKRGMIGDHFGLIDHFNCLVRQASGQPVGLMTASSRVFLDNTQLNYEAGFGYRPTSPGPIVYDSAESTVEMRLKVIDARHCDELEEFKSRRSTVLEMIHNFLPTVQHPEPRQEILQRKVIQAYNPMCETTKQDLQLKYKDIVFSCRYFGTEGHTSSFQ